MHIVEYHTRLLYDDEHVTRFSRAVIPYRVMSVYRINNNYTVDVTAAAATGVSRLHPKIGRLSTVACSSLICPRRRRCT